MRFFVFGFLFVLSFSIYANCAAPVELVLSVDESQPGTVVLEYGYDTKEYAQIEGDSSLIYRVGNDSEGEKVIYQFPFDRDTYDSDSTLIAKEKCVPPGTWTYVIPFSCYGAACNCINYAEVVVEDYDSDCENNSERSDLTFDDLKNKMRDESWYGEGPDESEIPDDFQDDEVDDDTDEVVDDVDEIIDDSISDEGDKVPDESQDENKISDDPVNEIQDSDNVDKSDGCSIITVI